MYNSLKSTNRSFLIALCFIIFLAPSVVLGADLTVILNKDVPAQSLTKEEVRSIFLGKKTKWDDGTKIIFFLIKSSKSQKAFLEAYVGKSPEQFEDYWLQNVFTGKGVMPDTVENSDEMVKVVGRTKGSIGFVTIETSDSEIKKLVSE